MRKHQLGAAAEGKLSGNMRVAKISVKVTKLPNRLTILVQKHVKILDKAAKILFKPTKLSFRCYLKVTILSIILNAKTNFHRSDLLIVKKRGIPLTKLKLEALIRRVPPSHPKVPILRTHLLKRNSGYQGELAIDYPLSFLSEKEYFIFHDLRLKISDHHFQLDTLIICKKFIIILEVKNITGSLYFDQEFHQLIRTLDGEETVFPDPVTQLKRQMFQLKQWLNSKQFATLPIIPFVVITNPKAIIKASNKELREIVINRHYLITKLQQIEIKFNKNIITMKEIKKISRLLLKEHSPLNQSILEQYGISHLELLMGVICPLCGHRPMERIYGTWFCEKCQQSNRNAHKSALIDYYLLYCSKINNQKAREFLNISSPFLTSRLLKSLNLTSSGSTKNKVYTLKFEEFKHL